MTEALLGKCLGPSKCVMNKQHKYSGTGDFSSRLWLAPKGWEPELGIHPGQDLAPYPFNTSMHASPSVHTPLLFAEKSWTEVTVYATKVPGSEDQKSGLQRYVEPARTLQTLGILNWCDFLCISRLFQLSQGSLLPMKIFSSTYIDAEYFLCCWREENRNKWFDLNSDTSKSEELTWATDKMQPARYKKKKSGEKYLIKNSFEDHNTLFK